jgi:hypothetical protein
MASLKSTVLLCVLLTVAAVVVCVQAPGLLREPTGEGNRPEQADRPPPPEGTQLAFLPPSMAIKQAAVQRLLSHQITLLQAARLFRYANEHPHATLEQVPEVLPARPDDPHHGHEVIAWVGRERIEAHDPGREALLGDLLRELHSNLPRRVQPPLPSVDPKDLPPAQDRK